MPVVQLQDDTGANLGRALGTAAGYFATRKARAAKNTQEQQQAKDTHDEITSRIAAETATTNRENQDTTNTQFQDTANAKAQALLRSPPAGKDPVAWANSVWKKAVADPVAEGGFGLTDPKLTGALYAQVQDVVAKATAAKSQQFAQGLKYPPNWNKMQPQQQIAYLQQRLNAAERAQNKDVVTATNAEIGRIQGAINAADLARHRGVTEGQGAQRISINLENANTRAAGGGSGAGLSDRANAVENKALTAPNQKAALRVVEQSGLSRKDRALVRQDILDQFKEPTPHDTSGLSAAGLLQYNKDVRDWMTGGQDPDSEPDPSNAKYQHKADALGAKSGGGATPQPQPTPGTKRSVSLKAAMALPGNRGKTAAQVQADIQAHGYSVTP